MATRSTAYRRLDIDLEIDDLERFRFDSHTPTGFDARAGAEAVNELTLKQEHSLGADQCAIGCLWSVDARPTERQGYRFWHVCSGNRATNDRNAT
jgi:hypothetical protein